MKTPVITTSKDSDGEMFTKDCLARLDGVDVPILIDFNVDMEVGKTTLKWDGDVIYTEWENKDFSGMYLVPGFMIIKRDGEVFEEIIVTAISLTNDPADTSLTPLGYIKTPSIMNKKIN